MSQERNTDILEEIEAEVAAELEEDRPPAGGPAHQIVSALAALALGAVGALLARSYGLGSLRAPGPGLWPFAVSLLIVILAVALLLVGHRLQDSERFTRSSLLVLVGIVTFVALAWLMPLVGFEIPSLLLCLIWLRFLGGEGWRSTVVGAVLMVAAFYLLFIVGLKAPIPHLI